MSSSGESEGEEEIMMKIKKIEEEKKLLEKKLEKKRKKKIDKIIECNNTELNQNPLTSPMSWTQEDDKDNFPPMEILPSIDLIVDEDITSCNADNKNKRFETKQIKKSLKLSKKLAKITLDPNEMASGSYVEYTRTGGQSSTSGAMYEVKVLALLYVRASARGWDFHLGTNVKQAGNFDDVTLAYTTDSGVRRQLLVQLSHKETGSISKAKLLAEDSKKHKFSLLKYYRSFRELRDNFATNKVLNSYSRFSDIDFVLFTNAAAEVSEGMLFTDADLRTSVDSVLNVNGKVFNFSENRTLIQEFKKKHASSISDDGSVTEFFNQFYVYSDQTREDDLRKQIDEEIKASFFISDYGVSKLSSPLIKLVAEWRENRAGTRHLKIDDFMFESGLKIVEQYSVESLKIKFKKDELSCVKKYLLSNSIQIINCVTNVNICGPACDKLAQSITETTETFFCVTLEVIQSCCEEILIAWPSKLCPILVIKYETEMPVLPKRIHEISVMVKDSLGKNKESKLILVSQQGILGKLLFPDDHKSSYTDLKIICKANNLTAECEKQVLQTVINFQGSNVQLQSILGENIGKALDELLLSLLTYGKETLQLGSMPDKPLFYIDRKLVCSHFLKKNIQQLGPRDLFAISGATEEQIHAFIQHSENVSKDDSENCFTYEQPFFNLKNMKLWYSDGTSVDTTLTAKYLIRNLFKKINTESCVEKPNKLQSERFDHSSTYVVPTREHFVIINNSQEFSKLCEQYKYRNIHWLEVVDGKLKWKTSIGDRNVIKRNISSEKEFISVNNVWDVPDRIVIVTGSPGLGKSTLLSQIAVNSKNKSPETCIISLDLREYADELRNLNVFIKPEEACEFLIRNSMSFEEMFQESFENFFRYILRCTGRAVVMLDGVDDVFSENEQKVVSLIKSLSKLSISKLWITSRYHLAPRLEGITGTIAFELQPLNMHESEEIFRRMGNNEDGVSEEMKNTAQYRFYQLLGNPRHCEMIAEAAQNNKLVTNTFFGSNSIKSTIVSILKTISYIAERKFQFYYKKNKNLILKFNPPVMDIEPMKAMFTMIYNYGALLHLVLLGIKFAKPYNQEESGRILKEFIETLTTGPSVTCIINKRRIGISQFEHRPYKYFLAWVAENSSECKTRVTKTILQRILVELLFSCVILFFRLMTSKHSVFSTAILQNYWRSLSIGKTLKSLTITKGLEVIANHKDEKIILNLASILWTHNIANKALTLLTKIDNDLKFETAQLEAKPVIEDGILNRRLFQKTYIRTVPWSIVSIVMMEKGLTWSERKELIERIHNRKQDALAGLAHAISVGNIILVSFLLENGVNVNGRVNEMGDTAMIIAAARGRYRTLIFLHSRSAIPMTRNYNGDSPMHWACLRGHMSVVAYLINRCNINPNIKNNSLCTPLHAAAWGGHLKIIKYLIEQYNCDPRERTKFGQSALCLAAGCSSDVVDTVKYLVEECGLNPNECMKNNCLPANIACMHINMEIIKFLIDKCKIDPHEETEKGKCLLQFMIKFLDVGHIKELLRSFKLSLDFTDYAGRTLFMRALKFSKLSMCEYLGIYCTNIKNTDKEGNTALHFYILNCEDVTVDFVAWLVETCHIDPNVVNLNGLTALQCAASKFNNPATQNEIQPAVIVYLQTFSQVLM